MNSYGQKRRPAASVLSPLEFVRVVSELKIGALMPPDLFIMDNPQGLIPEWRMVGTVTPQLVSPNADLGICLETTQIDADPLAVAVLALDKKIVRTKPYNRQVQPDLLFVLQNMTYSSRHVDLICPFKLQVPCSQCNRSITVLSYPPEVFNARLCKVCKTGNRPNSSTPSPKKR